MSVPLLVIDYGLGNLHSVTNAFAKVGATVTVSGRPDDILHAERVVLPGVGAFGDGMAALRAGQLDQALRMFVQTGRPLLGICLGMQLLLAEGEEFGQHDGLGIIPGRVSLIHPAAPAKIPHVGWSRLQAGADDAAGERWRQLPLRGLQPGEPVYFVHSFAAQPADPGHRVAEVLYGGQSLAAAVGRDNVLGCQFHPEKSGAAGLSLCKEFLAWQPH